MTKSTSGKLAFLLPFEMPVIKSLEESFTNTSPYLDFFWESSLKSNIVQWCGSLKEPIVKFFGFRTSLQILKVIGDLKEL